MNRIFFSAIALILSFALFVGCNDADKAKIVVDKQAEPAFDLVNARKQIDSANREFMDLISKGDSVALANAYTTDAKFMMPNQPPVTGRKNIQSVMAGLLSMGIKLNLSTVDVWGDESTLAEEGTFVMETKDGKQLDKGKSIVLWKKEDGKWKLFRDCFNSDLPVTSPKK